MSEGGSEGGREVRREGFSLLGGPSSSPLAQVQVGKALRIGDSNNSPDRLIYLGYWLANMLMRVCSIEVEEHFSSQLLTIEE